MEDVGVSRVELQVDLDAVLTGPPGERPSLGDDGVAGACLDEEWGQAGEVGVQRRDDRVVDGVPGEVERAQLAQQSGRDDRRAAAGRAVVDVSTGEIDQRAE